MPYSWPRDLSDAGRIDDYQMTGTSKTCESDGCTRALLTLRASDNSMLFT